jgi:hypothetical protein
LGKKRVNENGICEKSECGARGMSKRDILKKDRKHGSFYFYAILYMINKEHLRECCAL